MECCIRRNKRAKHESKGRKIHEEGNANRCEKIVRNWMARRPRENAYVVNRDGESRRFMVNSSVEIESRRDSRFVLLRPISYSPVIIVVPLPLILHCVSVHRNTSPFWQSTPFDRRIFSTKTLDNCENKRERERGMQRSV